MAKPPSQNPFENWEGWDQSDPVAGDSGHDAGLFDFASGEVPGPAPAWLTSQVRTHSGDELLPDVYHFFANPPPEIGTVSTAYSTRKYRAPVIGRVDTSGWHDVNEFECSFVGSQGVARFRQPKTGGRLTGRLLLFADATRLYADQTHVILQSQDAMWKCVNEFPGIVILNNRVPAYGYTECDFVWQGKNSGVVFDCVGRYQDPARCTLRDNREPVPADAYEPRLMLARSAEVAWTRWLLPHALKAARTEKGVTFRVKGSTQSLRFSNGVVVYQPASGDPVVIPEADAGFNLNGSKIELRHLNARHGIMKRAQGPDVKYTWEQHTIGNKKLLTALLSKLGLLSLPPE